MNAFRHIRLRVLLLVLPMVLGIAALLQAQAPSTTSTVTSSGTPAVDPGGEDRRLDSARGVHGRSAGVAVPDGSAQARHRARDPGQFRHR